MFDRYYHVNLSSANVMVLHFTAEVAVYVLMLDSWQEYRAIQVPLLQTQTSLLLMVQLQEAWRI